MPGTLDLIDRVRRGSSNKFSVIFACLGPNMEPQFVVRAGANFIVHPANGYQPDRTHVQVAASMMAAEKRRFFRYP